MIQNILRALRDRPILSIILCVILSQFIQLLITMVSKRPPAFHYGIAVMALLALFVTPVLLSIQNRKKKESPTDEGDNAEHKDKDESDGE